MKVQKSKKRTVITLAQGMFKAREICKQCSSGDCPPIKSKILQNIVKPGKKYGYDLIVYVGLNRYLEGKQRDEIREILYSEHGIKISAGSVSSLCDQFLSLLEALHLHRAPQLRSFLYEQGGYPLHIDATCDSGKGGLFVCLAGWQRWVLLAKSIPSESKEHLKPVIDKTVELFGDPIAVVRDMGSGGKNAVEDLRQKGIPDLICHYHFLAAVGDKLFDKLHNLLRNIIGTSQIRTDLFTLQRDLRNYDGSIEKEGRFGSGLVRENLKALVLWILDGEGKKYARFPFGLPHFQFVQRCLEAEKLLKHWTNPLCGKRMNIRWLYWYLHLTL